MSEYFISLTYVTAVNGLDSLLYLHAGPNG